MSTKMFLSPVNVGDVIYDVDREKFYLVEEVEPAGVYVKDFGAISAGATLQQKELTPVYPPKGYAFFGRILPVDDVRIYIRVAREAMRGAMKSVSFYIDDYVRDNIEYHPLAEIWCFDEMKFYVDIENPSTSAISTSRVRIIGYLYRLKEIPAEEAEGRKIVHVKTTPISMGRTE